MNSNSTTNNNEPNKANDAGNKRRNPETKTSTNPSEDPPDNAVGGAGDNPTEIGTGSNTIYRKLVPQPDNEPPILCKLSGGSISHHVELCGWSFMVPTKFFNINDNFRPLPMTDGRGEEVRSVEGLKAKSITLREMQQLIGNPNNPEISIPLFVHVAAKRKVDLFAYHNKVLIIPQVVIADKSGYCVLSSFNEGFATITNHLKVGDQLLITRCIPQLPRRSYHRGLFADEMMLNLEIKVNYLSARYHYLRNFSSVQSSQFVLPLPLFNSNCQLKLPRELEAEFQEPATNPVPWIPVELYYDIIGVVVYVGRIERFQNVKSQDVECLIGGNSSIRQLPRFNICRWIYLVDSTSSVTFPVKVFVTSNTNLSQQALLLPGAILVITHCQTTECPHFGRFVSTSAFSQLHMDAISYEKYFRIHPPSFRDKAQEIVHRQNYLEILSRPEVELSAGGTHAMKICSKEEFVSFYCKNRHRLYSQIVGDKPLQRRESVRLYFEGRVLRVTEYHDENVPQISYIHRPSYVTQMRLKDQGKFQIIQNFFTYTVHKNSSWYAFQRKLPSYNRSFLEEPKCRDIVKQIVTQNKTYCAPLLMPADIPEYNEHGPAPPLAYLERLDGPPYLMLDIVNEEIGIWYTCIWKSRQWTVEEKKARVEGAKDKKIICIAEVFCTEPGAPLEVNLLDFVTAE